MMGNQLENGSYKNETCQVVQISPGKCENLAGFKGGVLVNKFWLYYCQLTKGK